MYFILFILIPIVFLIYLIIKYPDRSIGTRSRNDIYNIIGYPLIGNLLDTYNIYITYLLYNILIEHGPLTTLTIPGIGRIITVNSPELLKHVLKDNFEDYVKGPRFSKIFYDVLGDGIFNSDGKMWKIQRKLTSYLFKENNFFKFYCKVFEEEINILLNSLQKAAKNDVTIDVQKLFLRFTMDSFGKIMFGINLSRSDESKSFARQFEFVQEILDQRFNNILWKFTELFTFKGAKMRSACRNLSEFTYDIINEKKNDEKTLKDDENILRIFINSEINDEGNVRKLTDKELRDIVINLIIAGRDTTAQAISWMIYNIITNPTVEEKLVNEANSLLSDKSPISDYEKIKQFKYTQAVFYETLRLYPSVPKNGKMCIKDNVLPNGIPIYAGEWVVWSSWAMGRDKRIWGEDAPNFIPERFESTSTIKTNEYKFNSFNGGPRKCLGQNFAMIQAITVITSIIRKFKFELLPNQKLPPDFAKTLTLRMKEPLMCKVRFRT